MNRTIALSAIAIALLGSPAQRAHGQQQPPPAMTFFIAQNPTGTGNLGGIAGADQICQNAAQAAGGLNFNHTWHAYLSQQQRGDQPRINARDRVGTGPWYNAKGQLIASSVADLHGDQQRDRNNIQRATALDARGNEIPGNEHDILTGSDSQGRAFTDGIDHTCNNWTSDGMTLPQQNANIPGDRARAMLGHMDRTGGQNTSWNAAHMSQGCSKQALNNTGGAGRIYCFAIE
jgi:Collagenase NC10 and Endostatin